MKPPLVRPIHVVLAILASACQAVQAPEAAAPHFTPAGCSAIAVSGRSTTMHLPSGRRGPRPLLLALHGLGGTGHDLEVDSGLDAVADREGAIVAYPDALRRQWNQAPAVMGSTPDDTGFLEQLVDRLVAAGCADAQRVYAIGVSNGGGMAYRLACDAAERIAAIGLVSADYLGSDRCSRSRPVPAIAFHGTADTRVPIDGVTYGTSVHPPVVSWATGWATRNGCSAIPTHAAVAGAHVLHWQACPQRADVVLYEVTGGAHGWFKAPIDANTLSWSFFDGRSLSH
jgi:polyhydroxybutyrate depolymerase